MTKAKPQPLKVKILKKKNYLAMIENSEGSRAFKNNFAIVDEEEIDITEDGNASCAYATSGLMWPFGLCQTLHAKTSGLVKDMVEESGWVDISIYEEPPPGSAIFYEQKFFPESGYVRDHIALSIGNGWAISNDDGERCLVKHPWNEYHERPVVRILWNPKLDDEDLS